jgi:penicillin-binding protein 1A
VLLGLLSVSCLAVVALLAGVALLGSLPGVGDAQMRVAAILREHRARPVGLPLPTRVASSVVAVEDQRFYTHHGVDLRSVARLAWSGLRGGDLQDEGGSTIAQQLAKRVYTGDRGGLAVKLRQVGLAVKLERRYSKDQILGMYLDAAYFGGGHWGVVQASRGYFGRSPSHLSWGEASLLAGLVQAPSFYDPTAHLAAAEQRQHHVLDRLVAAGVLSRAQADAAGRRLAAEARRLDFRTVQGT